MPRIRFVNGVVWGEVARAVGEEIDVTDREAFILCEGYKDAERVDGTKRVALPQADLNVIQTRDPVAAHRDPVIETSKRKGK